MVTFSIKSLTAYLITLYPAPLLQLGQHDNSGRPLLPYHPPEIGERLRERTLRGDVGVLLPVPVAVVGVDVVAAHDPVHRLQHHAAVVVGDHVGVPGQYYQSGTAIIIILSVELDSNFAPLFLLFNRFSHVLRHCLDFESCEDLFFGFFPLFLFTSILTN